MRDRRFLGSLLLKAPSSLLIVVTFFARRFSPPLRILSRSSHRFSFLLLILTNTGRRSFQGVQQAADEGQCPRQRLHFWPYLWWIGSRLRQAQPGEARGCRRGYVVHLKSTEPSISHTYLLHCLFTNTFLLLYSQQTLRLSVSRTTPPPCFDSNLMRMN